MTPDQISTAVTATSGRLREIIEDIEREDVVSLIVEQLITHTTSATEMSKILGKYGYPIGKTTLRRQRRLMEEALHNDNYLAYL